MLANIMSKSNYYCFTEPCGLFIHFVMIGNYFHEFSIQIHAHGALEFFYLARQSVDVFKSTVNRND